MAATDVTIDRKRGAPIPLPPAVHRGGRFSFVLNSPTIVAFEAVEALPLVFGIEVPVHGTLRLRDDASPIDLTITCGVEHGFAPDSLRYIYDEDRPMAAAARAAVLEAWSKSVGSAPGFLIESRLEAADDGALNRMDLVDAWRAKLASADARTERSVLESCIESAVREADTIDETMLGCSTLLEERPGYLVVAGGAPVEGSTHHVFKSRGWLGRRMFTHLGKAIAVADQSGGVVWRVRLGRDGFRRVVPEGFRPLGKVTPDGATLSGLASPEAAIALA